MPDRLSPRRHTFARRAARATPSTRTRQRAEHASPLGTGPAPPRASMPGTPAAPLLFQLREPRRRLLLPVLWGVVVHAAILTFVLEMRPRAPARSDDPVAVVFRTPPPPPPPPPRPAPVITPPAPEPAVVSGGGGRPRVQKPPPSPPEPIVAASLPPPVPAPVAEPETSPPEPEAEPEPEPEEEPPAPSASISETAPAAIAAAVVSGGAAATGEGGSGGGSGGGVGAGTGPGIGAGSAPGASLGARPSKARKAWLAKVDWKCSHPGIDEIGRVVVRLRVEILPSGKPSRITVIQPGPRDFNRRAIECARDEEYLPALDDDGRPIKGIAEFGIEFRM